MTKQLGGFSIACLLLTATIARAQDSAQASPPKDDLVCAAVYPCTEKGEVLAEYDSGPCAAVYAQQCLRIQDVKQTQLLSDCEIDRESAARRLRTEHRNNRRLRRRIKDLELQISQNQ